MFEMAVVGGSAGVFVAGFAAWYTLWHRRLAASFERVPVHAGRTAYLVRDGVVLGGTRSDGRVH